MLLISSGQAQTLRDPTLAPQAPGMSGPAAVPDGLMSEPDSMALVVRDGVRYLVLGTRLYAEGQTIGKARIVRITETEVWLREAGKLQKTLIFSGIKRSAASPAGAAKNPSDAVGAPAEALE